MNKENQRTKELAKRTLTYFIMTASMVALLFIMIFIMLGYRFDFDTRQVAQTGLVQYDSRPRGATVTADNKTVGTTQTKGTVMPGQRQFSMNLKGYEPWQKTLNINSNTVTQLDYARLVPEERKVSKLHEFTDLQAVSLASSGRYVFGLTMQNGQPVGVWGDLRDATKPKVEAVNFTGDKFKGFEAADLKKNHQFEIVSWGRDDKSIIIKHSYGDDKLDSDQWLLFNRDKKNNLLDVSDAAGINIRDVQFSDDNSLFVLQDGGNLRQFKVGDLETSRPLITGVKRFEYSGGLEVVAYVGEKDDVQVAGIWKKGSSSPQIVKRFDANAGEVQISVSRYFNRDTVVVSEGGSIQIFRGSLPGSDESLEAFLEDGKEFTINQKVDEIMISRGGRFVAAIGQENFVSYDLERQSLSQNIKLQKGTKVGWLDSHHVWHVDESNQAIMMDFDGLNSYTLMNSSIGSQVVLSSDERYIYTIEKSRNKTIINSLSMRLRQ